MVFRRTAALVAAATFATSLLLAAPVQATSTGPVDAASLAAAPEIAQLEGLSRGVLAGDFTAIGWTNPGPNKISKILTRQGNNYSLYVSRGTKTPLYLLSDGKSTCIRKITSVPVTPKANRNRVHWTCKRDGGAALLGPDYEILTPTGFANYVSRASNGAATFTAEEIIPGDGLLSISFGVPGGPTQLVRFGTRMHGGYAISGNSFSFEVEPKADKTVVSIASLKHKRWVK